MKLSSVNFNNSNFKNKSKKKKKNKKNSNKPANKFCELHKMNAIYMNKSCFHHNKTHFVFEYEIIVIADKHALFSTISVDWILDFGTTKHVYCNKAYFDHLEFYNTSLKWGSVNQISISDIDSIRLFLFGNSPNSFSAIRLENVLFVFELNICKDFFLFFYLIYSLLACSHGLWRGIYILGNLDTPFECK